MTQPLKDHLADKEWKKKGLRSLDKLLDSMPLELVPVKFPKDHLSSKPKRRLSSILRNRNV